MKKQNRIYLIAVIVFVVAFLVATKVISMLKV
jgi:type IV secretory pathway component VirB8